MLYDIQNYGTKYSEIIYIIGMQYKTHVIIRVQSSY